MTEIVWEDPPESAILTGQRARHAELIAALKENKGRWAKLPGGWKSTDSVKGTALNIRMGRMRGFTRGEFETAVDGMTLYVRFVGSSAARSAGDVEGTDPADAPEAEAGEVEGQRSSDVRAWGRANGFELGDRGALPRALVDAYRQAHTVTAPAGPLVESDPDV